MSSLRQTEKLSRDKLPEIAVKRNDQLKLVSLSELIADYVLFSYSAFMVYGDFEVDPVAHYISCYDNAAKVTHVWQKIPVFKGITVFWDHIVTAVGRESWGKLSTYLNSLTVVDLETKLYNQPLRQKLPLLLPDSTNASIITFGVDGNTRSIYFNPAADIGHPITLRAEPPLDETVQLAKFKFSQLGVT